MPQVPHLTGEAEPEGLGVVGKGRADLWAPWAAQAGAGMGRDVANAWHSSCISGTAPRQPGNQKYLVPREAPRVTGTDLALSGSPEPG